MSNSRYFVRSIRLDSASQLTFFHIQMQSRRQGVVPLQPEVVEVQVAHVCGTANVFLKMKANWSWWSWLLFLRSTHFCLSLELPKLQC